MSLQPGENAPNFNLFNTEKKPVSLEGQKGKNVVLLFFSFGIYEYLHC